MLAVLVAWQNFVATRKAKSTLMRDLMSGVLLHSLGNSASARQTFKDSTRSQPPKTSLIARQLCEAGKRSACHQPVLGSGRSVLVTRLLLQEAGDT